MARSTASRRSSLTDATTWRLGRRTWPSNPLSAKSTMPAVTDRYGAAVLSGDWRAPRGGRSREVEAEAGLVVEDVETGWVGAVVRVEKAGGVHVVHLEDRHGRTKGFRLGPGFLVDGAPVTLTRPRAGGIRAHRQRLAGRDRPTGQGRERVEDLRRGQARRRARREGVGRGPA